MDHDQLAERRFDGPIVPLTHDPRQLDHPLHLFHALRQQAIPQMRLTPASDIHTISRMVLLFADIEELVWLDACTWMHA